MRFVHAAVPGRPGPEFAMEHPPPPAEPAEDPPDPAAAADDSGGEARKACVSPVAVSPDPATCPESFSETASVDIHPGKESSS